MSFNFDRSYVPILRDRLVSENLILKYLQILPILGPGTWLLNTYARNNREYMTVTENVTDSDLVYAPYEDELLNLVTSRGPVPSKYLSIFF